ncbi:MAG: folylpolyglutamate synthase/dihydrofolate synthase family protein [Thermodesulfobacteriota bacterium]|nr:folylpolyglutamate synthase/dihydrofolate synthase family protein [Thermodesulfobacteriota bacterium]
MAGQESLQYLSNLRKRGIRLGLGPLTGLLEHFDNPQRTYKSILIAGTNGKGSVAAILSSILQMEGLKVGLFTSPHLVDFEERIRVNGVMISREELCHLIDELRGGGDPEVTYFEFATALAFLYFSRCRIDIAVLEVGMGGRLDATNLVTPEVSIITNIAMEHSQYLGRNLRSIAGEKGGIIKRGGVCVTGVRKGSALEALEDISQKKGATLYRVGRDFKVRRSGPGRFSYYGIKNIYRNVNISLIGRHQLENTALSLAAAEIMASKGLKIEDDSLIDGVRDAKWEGRLEIVNTSPQVILDGAHNPAGITALSKVLSNELSFGRLTVVFGVLGDKDYKAMLRRLAPLADHVILTGIGEERALEPKDMETVARFYNDDVEVVRDSRGAILRALDTSAEDDLICVTGSLYLIGEIKRQSLF